MNTRELYKLINSVGLPVSYSDFSGKTDKPYIAYYESAEVRGTDFDNRVKVSTYYVELYTLKRDTQLEDKIETLFDSRGYEYSVDYALYLDTADCYVTTYEVRMTYKKGK